ncbi:MAG: recombinase zinc beta ribbon domain-containing protein [Patescibacteria group bacterium]
MFGTLIITGKKSLADREPGRLTGIRILANLGNIYLILRNTFYYGEFEYPIKSGNWYQGKHIPIITKELFDKVQTNLNENFIPKTESKEFAFTKLIRCGYCGSSITVDEKFKKLKGGGVNRHVYYFCTRGKNIDCKNPPLNEPTLIEELINLIDRINLDELGIREKIEQEINRFNKFRIGVLGHKKETRNSEVDIKNYAKYLLREGSIYEKRELLSFLKTKLTLKDKKIDLE